jgi:hypothetical protein
LYIRTVTCFELNLLERALLAEDFLSEDSVAAALEATFVAPLDDLFFAAVLIVESRCEWH